MSEKEKQKFLRDVQDFWEKDVEIKKNSYGFIEG